MVAVRFMKHSLTCSAVFAEASKNIMFFSVASCCAFSVGTTCYDLRSDLLPDSLYRYQSEPGRLRDQRSFRLRSARNLGCCRNFTDW